MCLDQFLRFHWHLFAQVNRLFISSLHMVARGIMTSVKNDGEVAFKSDTKTDSVRPKSVDIM